MVLLSSGKTLKLISHIFCLSQQGGLIIVFGAVEGLLLFLCGSGEYDELTLADMLSTLAKSIVSLCRQGGKNHRATESVRIDVRTLGLLVRTAVFLEASLGRNQAAPRELCVSCFFTS